MVTCNKVFTENDIDKSLYIKAFIALGDKDLLTGSKLIKGLTD